MSVCLIQGKEDFSIKVAIHLLNGSVQDLEGQISDFCSIVQFTIGYYSMEVDQ